MNLKTFVPATATLIALMGFQPAAHAGFKLGQLFEAKPIDLTAEPAPTAEKAVKCENMKKLKDVKKVVVSSFDVQFVTARKANAHAGGTSDKGAAYVHSDVTLKGLDDSVFQAITDQAYTNFVNELKTNGYEVMPYAEYAALPDYEQMKGAFDASPMNDKAMFSGMPTRIFAPTGMPVVFYGDEATVSASSKLGATTAALSHAPVNVEPKIVKQTGVPVVRVFLLVDFCQIDTSGGMFSSSASVKTKPQLMIGRESRAVFLFGSGFSDAQNVHLANYAYGKENYINAYNDVTTTGQAVGDAAANVIGILGGTGDMHKTRSYEAEADPEAYKMLSVKYLGDVSRLWLEAVKTSAAK
jgi:hypothetical protein